jgi:hypothetical protein
LDGSVESQKTTPTDIFLGDIVQLAGSEQMNNKPAHQYLVKISDGSSFNSSMAKGVVKVSIPADAKFQPSLPETHPWRFYTVFNAEKDWYEVIRAEVLIIDRVAPIYSSDFSDIKVLVGAAHNIFIGRVVEQVSTKERGIGPETQFAVDVVSNIKGNLDGRVVVNQQAGFRDGTLYVISDNDPRSNNVQDYLLTPGSTYILATRYNKSQGWYTLNSYSAAKKLLSSDISMSAEELRVLVNNNSRVQELRAAYPNEILLVADVEHNNALNSYSSIHGMPANVGYATLPTTRTIQTGGKSGKSAEPRQGFSIPIFPSLGQQGNQQVLYPATKESPYVNITATSSEQFGEE